MLTLLELSHWQQQQMPQHLEQKQKLQGLTLRPMDQEPKPLSLIRLQLEQMQRLRARNLWPLVLMPLQRGILRLQSVLKHWPMV